MFRWALPGPAFRLCRAFCLVFFLVVPALSPAQSGNDDRPTFAPLNPAFVEYMNSRSRQARQLRQFEAGEAPTAHTTGKIPGPMDYSHLAQQAAETPHQGSLPSSYDLRTANGVNRVTAVRDQGSCGSCWAFATYGAMESELLPGETRDFSENNLKNLHGFDWGPCDGGLAQISAAYLARWGGPINESDDPYLATSAQSSPTGLSPQKHIQDINIYPPRTSSTDNDILKTAVMTYGGLHTSIYMSESSSYYNSSTGAYYYHGNSSTNQTNHDVTLVGWDDNYPASNFPSNPGHNGAFLIKNSWGTYWGNQGYFWVSYYDDQYAKFDQSYAYIGAESIANYARQYLYDPLGQVGPLGYGGTTAWFANVFTAVASEPLNAVSFWANANSTAYLIKIYTNVTGSTSPTSGTLALSTSGTIPVAGYHTVKLPTSVALTSGQKFSVVVQATTPGYNYPVPLEYALSNYSSKATASAGQGFVSSNGSAWTDATTLNGYSNASVSLKAFSGSGYVLTVNSTNPASGVSIGVNPVDTSGSGTGSTSFTRVYPSGTTVTLTAPSASFSSWTGCDSVSGVTCTVSMTTNKTVIANYPGYTLTVNSTNPSSGMSITVSPADLTGNSSGTTGFSRNYRPGTQVTLTAPPTVTGGYFSGWTGCTQASGITCTVTMNADTTVTAANVSGSTSVAPAITSLLPKNVAAGSAGFTLTVNGTGFIYGAGVVWKGSDRTSTTTWVSPTQLTVPIAAADVASADLVSVYVKNPTSISGAISPYQIFVIDSPGSDSSSVAVSTTSATVTLKPGSNASIPVTFTGTNASAQITATCYNLPTGASCSYANGTVSFSTSSSTPAGTYAVIVLFTIRQTQYATLRHRAPIFALWTPLATLPFGLLWVGARRRKILPWLALLALLLILAACGGGKGSSSVGSSQNATQATLQTSLPVTMTVSQ